MTVTQGPAVPRTTFIGRVHPERYEWNVSELISTSFQDSVGTDYTAELTLRHSQVSIVIDADHPHDLITLKNLATSFANVLVNTMGFAFGAALQVEIVSCVTPSGDFVVFNSAFPGLIESRLDDSTVAKLANAGVQDPQVGAALADINLALLDPSSTSELSYRAIESIRQVYARESPSKSASWSGLREGTGVSQEDLVWLERRATPRRHGELADETEADRRRALQLARQVVMGHLARLPDVSPQPP